MAFLIDDILRIPGTLLRRVVTVKKGSRQMMLAEPETADVLAPKALRRKRPSRLYRTGEDLQWPKTVPILDNTLLAPLKFVRWVVNRLRRQVDLEVEDESASADEPASRSRPGSRAQGRRHPTSSDQR